MNKKSNPKTIKTLLIILIIILFFVAGYYIAIYRVYETQNVINLDSVYEYCKLSKCNQNDINSSLSLDNQEIVRQTIFRGKMNFIDTNTQLEIPDNWFIKYTETVKEQNYILMSDEDSQDFASLKLVDLNNWTNVDDGIVQSDKEKTIEVLNEIYSESQIKESDIEKFNQIVNYLFGDDSGSRTQFNYLVSQDGNFKGFSYLDKNNFESVYFPVYYVVMFNRSANQMLVLNYFGAEIDEDLVKLNEKLEQAYYNSEDYNSIADQISQLITKNREDYSYGEKLNLVDKIVNTLKLN